MRRPVDDPAFEDLTARARIRDAAIRLFAERGIAGTTVGLKLASDRLAQLEAEKERADEEAALARAVDDFVQKDLLGQADIGNQPGGARDRNITEKCTRLAVTNATNGSNLATG